MVQEELQRRALALVEQQGLSQGQAEMVGVHRQTVNIWLKRYRQQGEEGMLDDRRMSPQRDKGALSIEAAGQVRAAVALWTSGTVCALIARWFGKQLGPTAVQLYLRR